MSLIHEHYELEKTVNSCMERMAEIEADPAFKREKEFENKLRALLADYHRDLKSVIAMLDPQSRRPASVAGVEKQHRKARQTIVYTNPNDNSVVESKGGNNRVLKAWNEQYGRDVVKSWGKPKGE